MVMRMLKQFYKSSCRAFTLIELIVVIVVMAIAAVLAVPMMSSAADMQLQAAANMLAADIEYAKNLAVSRQKNHAIIIDTTNEAYEVRVYNTLTTNWDLLEHPTKSGADLSVSFAGDNRLSSVDITTVNFQPGGSTAVTFDYLGSPYSGLGTASPLNSGEIILTASSLNMTVTVQPVTGYVTIQ